MLADTYTSNNDIDFWSQSGVFVFTTIGNLLLYRICWAIAVYVWSKYEVSYISVLSLSNNKPNFTAILTHLLSLLFVYFIILLLFYRATTVGSVLYGSFLGYAAPLVLLGASILYQAYEYFFLYGGSKCSRGVFSRKVIRNCLKAPFVAVNFRDVFAADILTSFTRISQDSLYMSCWVVSGAFLVPHDSPSNEAISTNTNFGSNYMQCTNSTMGTVASLSQVIPLLIRTFQCLRGFRDANFVLFPNSCNAIKYILSILVVVVNLPGLNLAKAIFYPIVVVRTLYKWWWDVIMDWGLLSSWSLNRRIFLRPNLMYPKMWVYHICILVDLALRFVWVLSLLPLEYSVAFLGNRLTFFLGSLEILRRSMWSIFRVEWEHVKLLNQNKPGYLPNRFLRQNEFRHKKELTSTIRDLSQIGDCETTIPNEMLMANVDGNENEI